MLIHTMCVLKKMSGDCCRYRKGMDIILGVKIALPFMNIMGLFMLLMWIA